MEVYLVRHQPLIISVDTYVKNLLFISAATFPVQYILARQNTMASALGYYNLNPKKNCQQKNHQHFYQKLSHVY